MMSRVRTTVTVQALSLLLIALVHQDATAAETDPTANQPSHPIVHLRAIGLAPYLSFNKASTSSGGMIITAPFGATIDPCECALTPQTFLIPISFGFYGPALNWAGFAKHQPWSPVLLGGVQVGIFQVGFRTDAPTRTQPRPGAVVFGLSLFSAATADLLASPQADAWQSITAGAMLATSYTPAGW